MENFAQRKIYSVSEITSDIRQTLEQIGIIWVQGEISNFKHHSSGHMYFSLKDDRAQLKAACFRRENYYLKFRPEDGLEVLVRGRISVYEPRGDYQLIAEYMEPVGIGSLQLAFEQLKEKLRKEGLFAEDKKLRLPLLPHRVGIVTSPTGAAIRDMLRVLERRNASLHVLLYPARVQGTGAAREIADGISYFNTRRDIDVIIVGRGGGSMEDLWAFNEEVVARAIYASRIPLISAVGHETDVTISDFVADVRAPTPSAAAEIVSGAKEDLKATVLSFTGRMLQAMRIQMDRRRLQLERLTRNRAFNVAPNKIRELEQRFDEAMLRMSQEAKGFLSRIRHRCDLLELRLTRVDLRRQIARSRELLERSRQRLHSGVRMGLQRERSRLSLATGRMDALSPLAILNRGYAICRDERGVILRKASDTGRGARVDVTLSRGVLLCRVEQASETTEGDGGTTPNASE